MVELDYKTVKKEVWSKFIKIYGGGPSIIREKPYIYSSTVVEDVPAASLRNPSPLPAAPRAGKKSGSFIGNDHDNSKKKLQLLDKSNKQ